ncbi:MAG TPA: hypothetical protein VG167_04240 [Verrucomicrobiae bacterium]|nr:hypothetical protein [Verrucomicrobiae bacterium]
MGLRLKEQPKEWRKATWLTLLGLGLLSSVLRWRHVLAGRTWLSALSVLAALALLAWAKPGWFRGYYRLSMRLGYWLAQGVARVALALVFVCLITPLGIVLRWAGKDALRLKPSRQAQSYWTDARPSGPLDRLF